MDLVFVGGTDAAAGGADGGAAGGGFGGELDHAVVRQDDLGAVGDEELPVDGEAGVLESFDFGEEGHGIEDDAVADDAFALWPEDAAGDELQDELFAGDDDGMAGVVAAGVAGDDVEALGQDVDDFAFALIAPLGTKNHRGSALGHVRFCLRKGLGAGAARGPHSRFYTGSEGVPI